MPDAPSAAKAVARGKVFAPELPIGPLNAFNTNNRRKKAMFGMWEWGKR
jgi:hypothetical protein